MALMHSSDSPDCDVSPNAWAMRLLTMGVRVRDAVRAARDTGMTFATPLAEEGGDTIFAIDRHVEPVLNETIADWPTACQPLLLVAEGCGADGRRRFNGKQAQSTSPGYRLLIDPIDGTRNLMYDKRSAWFIAAVAADHGEATTLRNAIAAVMVELPTTKAGYTDLFRATHDGPAIAQRECLRTGERMALPLRPSEADNLLNGFAQVSNFFPGVKVLASQLMERIVSATLGEVSPGSASVYDDQYIATAGQMVELMMGRDRFCCDLRPLLYAAAANAHRNVPAEGLACHPYDVAGLLAAERAGVIVTDGFGRPLDAPFDVHHPVHWCGYANKKLQRAIEPVIQAFLGEHGVTKQDGRTR